MTGHRFAAFGLSALIAASVFIPLPTSAREPGFSRDDDDEEKPSKGPRLAPGKAPGLALTLSRDGLRDTRAARLVAIGVPAGTPPSPFLPPGAFRVTWEGDLAAPFRSEFAFSAEGRGTARVEVNGKAVLDASGDDLGQFPGKPARLKKGANRLVVTYDSPASGDAFFRLSWSSEDFPREPIPPVALAHDSDHEALAAGARLREGRMLVAELRCLKCHAPGSPVGGPSSMPELATDAPNLERVGARLRPEWMARWIEDPRALRPSATMPKMLHDQPATPARDIAAYLATLGDPDEAPGPRGSPEAGGRLFANLGCVGCHSLPGVDDLKAGPARIPLRLVGAKWKPAALVAFLQGPDRHYAWIKMPDFHLKPDEAADLAAYVGSPPVVDLGRPGLPPGDPGRGKALFASAGCASCHALPGLEATRATPFAAIGPDRWSGGCLAPGGSGPRKAPDFGLAGGPTRALQGLAKVGLGSMALDPAPEFAERQVKALNCAACHKRDGWSDEWADRKAETDGLLAGSPASEKDPDGLPYPADQVRPSLTWIGEKLKPEWASAFIAGKVSYKPRPYLRARMPAFPTRAEGLASGLALAHGFPGTSPPDPAPDPALIPAAKQLVKNSGLNCVSCHNIGPVAAVGVFEAPGINFMRAKERLRQGYFGRWARSPIRVEPETKMPTYFNGETSVLPSILEGRADRQIDALWNYLLQGPAIEPPGN